jgi:predicted kinase
VKDQPISGKLDQEGTQPVPSIHLIIGPVGSGKSTFAHKLGDRTHAVRLTLDEWMAVLYADDERPVEARIEWFVERTERCLDLIWRLTERLLLVGTSVVLEVGLIQREARQRFYSRIDEMAYDHIVYVVDADRDIRRERVLNRNKEQGETFSVDVPLDFFEFASDLWEAPDDSETSGREFRFVPT